MVIVRLESRVQCFQCLTILDSVYVILVIVLTVDVVSLTESALSECKHQFISSAWPKGEVLIYRLYLLYLHSFKQVVWPNGKALDYESRDSRFDPWHDHQILFWQSGSRFAISA